LLSITREQGVIERDLEDQDSNHNFIPDDLSGYKMLRKGQFGMNKMKAWQGSYGVSDYTGIVSPAYFIFDFAKPIEPKFFNWAIRSKLYVSYFGSASDGVRIGQWDLSKDRMKAIPFILPTTCEQKSIADFLDAKTAQVDEAIAIKEKQIALLKERKQIIIQKAVTQGLNPDVPMKDSGVEWIGQIPEHWAVKKAKHFSRIRSGDSITNSELFDEGRYEVYGGNGFMGFSSKFNVEGDTIVIGRVGALCGNVRYISERKWISDNALILKLGKTLDYHYATLLLDIADLNKLNTSSAQPLITGSKVMNFSVPIPPLEERERIMELISVQSANLNRATDILFSQIEKLKEYKTTLINSAVTGKIKVA
jgi:type I restriction enzyme S subunit